MSESRLNRFNKIAWMYDGLSQIVFGSSIRNSQTYFLDLIPENSSVLILGGGTGWWLNNLLKKSPTSTIYYVEASSSMIKLAKGNCNNYESVHFIHGTENDIPNKKYDVVITYFFLDMFNEHELIQLISKIKLNSKAEVMWIVSDFVNIKFWHKIFLFAMYSFFYVTRTINNLRLPNWHAELSNCGFKEIKAKSYYAKFIKSSVYRAIGKID